jgi:hypothetical protein
MKAMATYWRMRRLRLALLRWIRERNEVKLKRDMGWRNGWQRGVKL